MAERQLANAKSPVPGNRLADEWAKNKNAGDTKEKRKASATVSHAPPEDGEIFEDAQDGDNGCAVDMRPHYRSPLQRLDGMENWPWFPPPPPWMYDPRYFQGETDHEHDDYMGEDTDEDE